MARNSRGEVGRLRSADACVQLPAGWELVSLGDVASLQPGYAFKSQWFAASGIRLLRGTNIVPGGTRWDDVVFLSEADAMRYRDYTLEHGDIVIAMDRPLISGGLKVARLAASDVPALLLQRVGRFRITSRILREYLFAFLGTNTFIDHIGGQATGTQLPHVSSTDVHTAPFPLAPLPQQRRIVEKLDALTAKSRRAKESLDAIPPLLERFRQSVLAAAFRGDLTKDWRAKHRDVEPIERTLSRVKVEESKTGRAAAVTQIDGNAALAVGMSSKEAPRGWKWVPLTKVAKLESGHTPSRSRPEWWGGDVPWISIPDARDHHGKTIETTATHTNKRGLENSAARLLPAGTVCLSRTASVGYVTIMARPMATSQDFANWVCSEAVLPEWLMYLFLAEADALERFAHGAIHSTIYFPELKAFHVCLPPVEEQRAIVEVAKARLSVVHTVTAVVEAARKAHSTLEPAILAKAFRGQLVD